MLTALFRQRKNTWNFKARYTTYSVDYKKIDIGLTKLYIQATVLRELLQKIMYKRLK